VLCDSCGCERGSAPNDGHVSYRYNDRALRHACLSGRRSLCPSSARQDPSQCGHATERPSADQVVPCRRQEKVRRAVLFPLSVHENIRKLLAVKDERILYIKLADRLHNMRTIEGHQEVSKQKKVAVETPQFFVPMAKSLGLTLIAEELKERPFKVLNCKQPLLWSIVVRCELAPSRSSRSIVLVVTRGF
jgi:HD domain